MGKYKPMIGDKIRAHRCAARGDLFCCDGIVIGIFQDGMISIGGHWERRKTDRFSYEYPSRKEAMLAHPDHCEPRGSDDA